MSQSSACRAIRKTRWLQLRTDATLASCEFQTNSLPAAEEFAFCCSRQRCSRSGEIHSSNLRSTVLPGSHGGRQSQLELRYWHSTG